MREHKRQIVDATPAGQRAATAQRQDASAHAALLSRAGVARPIGVGGLMRRLQRQYGNQYATQVVALARQTNHGDAFEAPTKIEQTIQRERGGGQALESAARDRMESTFGADFSGVRVHTDARSDSLNRALSARAFTTGQDIFFRQGEYNPASAGGQALLAHELTHVVQQSGTLQTKLTVGAPDDAYEQEADQVARMVVQRQSAMPAADSSLAQRYGDEEQQHASGQAQRMPAHTLSNVMSRLPIHRKPTGELQRKFIATGKTADFVALVNAIIAVQNEIAINAATGELSIKSTNVQGPPTLEASTLLDLLKKVINDAGTVTIDFVTGSKSVIVGSYALSTIDLSDVKAFGVGPQRGVAAAGKLAHEIEEQYQKQVKGQGYGSETTGAHSSGIAFENAVTGATRGVQGPLVGLVSHADGSLSFKVTIPYTYPDGKVVDVTYTVDHNNVIKVDRVERP